MLNTISIRKDYLVRKFRVGSIPRTPGVELLRWMLFTLDVPANKGSIDYSSVYTEILGKYADTCKVAFDPVYSKSLSKAKFAKGPNNTYPVEILLNTTITDVTKLPFNGDWDKWEHVRALRIVYHTSTDLPIAINGGLIDFPTRCPEFMLMSIDVPVLLLKWLKFKEHMESNGAQPDELVFIKQFEFVYFFDDLVDIWITNMLNAVLGSTDEAAVIGCRFTIPAMWTSQGIVDNGIAGIQDIARLLECRAITFQDFLNTNWYPALKDGGERRSAKDVIFQMESEELPSLRTYSWMEILRCIPYLQMLVSIIGNDVDNPVYRTLMLRAYNLYVKEIKFANLPVLQYSNILKTYVQLACNTFENLFKGKLDVE